MNENVMNRLDTELEHAGERCETQLLCLQLEKLPLSAEHALEMVSFC